MSAYKILNKRTNCEVTKTFNFVNNDLEDNILIHYNSVFNGISFNFNLAFDQFILPEEALGDINIHFRNSVSRNVSNQGEGEKFHFLYTDPGMKAHLRKFSAPEVEQIFVSGRLILISTLR